MNLIGAIAALAAFMSVWFGHVAVRKIEFISPKLWLPVTAFVTLGLFVEFLSLSTTNRPLSTALGIFGITLLIDAFELRRQQNRVKIGHAAANPHNPRHARILAQYPTATTQDLLKRNPTGHSSATMEPKQPITTL
jgi:hypothetical protein